MPIFVSRQMIRRFSVDVFQFNEAYEATVAALPFHRRCALRFNGRTSERMNRLKNLFKSMAVNFVKSQEGKQNEDRSYERTERGQEALETFYKQVKRAQKIATDLGLTRYQHFFPLQAGRLILCGERFFECLDLVVL